MTWDSGPALAEDLKGRASAHGFAITGDDTSGYRAHLLVGLTAQEATYGCVELLYAESLADLLVLAHAEKIKRSMIGYAEHG